MAKINNKAFTLVELLAVIVILAVILVIAVPSIISTITESRKGALSSSAKLIASSAESMKISNQALGIEKDITCQDVSSYTEEDYTCDLEFVDGKAKVTLVGKGKFEGMSVCTGTKEEAEVTEGTCDGTGGNESGGGSESGGSTGGSSSVTPVSFSADSWETIKAAVTAGNTSNYNVGDTKTVDLGSLGTHTVRIANKTACNGTLESETACGFVIEFADIITVYNMNTTDTNAGGWPASAMRAYVNGDIYNALVAAIEDTDRTMIIDTTVVSGHGSGDTSNFTSTDKVYLLSTREVWGKKGTINVIGFDRADGDTITRQLDYYENNNLSTESGSGGIKKNSSNKAADWWLRSAYAKFSNRFYTVSSSSIESFDDATTTCGVSPAFRLG